MFVKDMDRDKTKRDMFKSSQWFMFVKDTKQNKTRYKSQKVGLNCQLLINL